MFFIKHMKLRFQQMFARGKGVKADSKFLILVFLICLVPICIATFVTDFSEQGNMITIRTMFSSILGYIIENISQADRKNKQIGLNVEEVNKSYNNIKQEETSTYETESEDEAEKEESKVVAKDLNTGDNKQELELRILIIGHLLLVITCVIIVGAAMKVEQNNQSLVLMKNTAFSCIGFLVSATRNNRILK